MSKFFYSDRAKLVDDAIEGLISTAPHQNLVRLEGNTHVRVVVRSDWNKSRVAVISGGESSHELAQAGFVGKGMLTAAVCGDLFTPPGAEAILSAIVAVTGDRGCLLIVKNNTGDRFNFGLAAGRAQLYGLKVKMIIVADNIAQLDNAQPPELAGIVLVHKIAGYAAECGKPLEEVFKLAQSACDNIYSIATTLHDISPPEGAEPERIASENAEPGLRTHGEPGDATHFTIDVRNWIDATVARLRAACGSKQPLAVLLNNSGGISDLEMNLLASVLLRADLGQQITLFIGPASFFSAPDKEGFSISALCLNSTFIEALTSPVEVAGWQPAIMPKPVTRIPNRRLNFMLDDKPREDT